MNFQKYFVSLKHGAQYLVGVHKEVWDELVGPFGVLYWKIRNFINSQFRELLFYNLRGSPVGYYHNFMPLVYEFPYYRGTSCSMANSQGAYSKCYFHKEEKIGIVLNTFLILGPCK